MYPGCVSCWRQESVWMLVMAQRVITKHFIGLLAMGMLTLLSFFVVRIKVEFYSVLSELSTLWFPYQLSLKNWYSSTPPPLPHLSPISLEIPVFVWYLPLKILSFQALPFGISKTLPGVGMDIIILEPRIMTVTVTVFRIGLKRIIVILYWRLIKLQGLCYAPFNHYPG